MRPLLPTVIDSLYLNYAVAGLGGRYCEGKLALTTGLSSDDLTLLGTLSEAEGANLACHNTDATGRAAGLAITAAAQAFSDASGVAAKKTAYTTAQGGVTLQALAQGTGTDDAGDDIVRAMLSRSVAMFVSLTLRASPLQDAYIISALDSTGIFADGAAVGYGEHDRWHTVFSPGCLLTNAPLCCRRRPRGGVQEGRLQPAHDPPGRHLRQGGRVH